MNFYNIISIVSIMIIFQIAHTLPNPWLSYGSTTPKELTPFFNQSKLVAMEVDKSQPQAKYVDPHLYCTVIVFLLICIK